MTQPQPRPVAEPGPRDVEAFHRKSDLDASVNSQHHTLGSSGSQAAPGDHSHDGRTSRQLTNYIEKPGLPPSVTGSRGGNIALTNLLAELESLGLIRDQTSI